MKMKKYLLFLAIAALAVVLVACGGGSDDGNAEGDNTEDTGTEEETSGSDGENTSEGSEELSGEVIIDGSGTVFPLMSVLAEEYQVNEQPGVTVEVGRAGTGGGFERFLNGETDFNDASRPISEEEQATAEENGIEYQEMKLALDGLTIAINPENDWATEMTSDEVIGIFTGEYTNWSDINSEWPDEKIQTYGPNENHGTYEFMFETIMEETPFVEDVNLQQEYPTLVSLVADDVNGIGFFGYGYYEANQDNLQAVSIDFGEGPVEPSLDTIAEDGPYAGFTRPVFTYLNTAHAQEKPQVLDYAIWTMNNVSDFVAETGFAPIPQEEIDAEVEELEGLQQ
ncbi:PstS family phosphate ABC transporter substrate-binding protein [Lentibacillus sediminis]|uniref:PstS family phosphate ABC transporter substrate-binding protein n=1 Tax=Lentibacillus sediminis TaxID=1940529 RepID=UPI000C1C4C3A|nr:PstS family phosphate ABC transporter substrate-binding protein [Lentibacillus sediminis]